MLEVALWIIFMLVAFNVGILASSAASVYLEDKRRQESVYYHPIIRERAYPKMVVLGANEYRRV